jgi:hypothetical protein
MPRGTAAAAGGSGHAGDHCTVNVPSMPAWRWPGTEQKNLYVPGLRLTETLFAPPENVGVAPTFSPDDDSIVTLCGSDEEFVKSTATLPALAVSDFVLYSSWPSGLASSFTLLEPPEAAGAGVDVLAELVVGVVSAGVLVLAAVEEELDEELPQPASASSATASASTEMIAFERFVVRPAAAGSLTADPPLVGVVGHTTPPGADPSRSASTGGRQRHG